METSARVWVRRHRSSDTDGDRLRIVFSLIPATFQGLAYGKEVFVIAKTRSQDIVMHAHGEPVKLTHYCITPDTHVAAGYATSAPPIDNQR